MLSEESYTTLSLGDPCCTLTEEKEILVGCFLLLKQEVEHVSLLPSPSAPRMAAPPTQDLCSSAPTLKKQYQRKRLPLPAVRHIGS